MEQAGISLRLSVAAGASNMDLSRVPDEAAGLLREHPNRMRELLRRSEAARDRSRALVREAKELAGLSRQLLPAPPAAARGRPDY